jgi:sugar O-acyltransferase (sialic acid O-acetyltransferase NeuD family)
MKKLVIYGVSRASAQSYYDFTTDSHYELGAFTLEKSAIKEPTFFGLPVVPFEEVETIYPPSEYMMFVAVYFKRVNQTRMQKFEQAKAKGYELANFISSKAIVWPGLKVSENVMIAEGAIVKPYTQIGMNTFILTGAVVSHDCVVGNHCYLAVRSVMLASAQVGDCSVIGGNATILNGVKVAKSNIISAGAVINSDTKDFEVYTVPQPTLQPLPSDKMANIIFKVQV